MGVVFVDGDLMVTSGTLYTRSISAGSGNFSDNARIIIPPNGVLEITEDTGSIFDTYYVSGGVSASGIFVGDVVSVLYKHRFTVSDYEKGKEQICYILNHINDSVLEEEFKNILYQQQFASVISLMEHYLSCSLWVLFVIMKNLIMRYYNQTFYKIGLNTIRLYWMVQIVLKRNFYS